MITIRKVKSNSQVTYVTITSPPYETSGKALEIMKKTLSR